MENPDEEKRETKTELNGKISVSEKKPTNKLVNDLDANKWREYSDKGIIEFGSIWEFPERGDYGMHKGDYRGNFSPKVPRQCILRYSKKGETVLDVFLGSGTTLIETKILGRKGIGVEINPDVIKLAKRRVNQQQTLTSFSMGAKKEFPQKICLGDARNLRELKDTDTNEEFSISDESIHCIITHPPYHDIIQYSENIQGDLSLCSSVDDFLKGMKAVFVELWRVLKTNRYMCMLIGDAWKNKVLIPLGFELFQIGLETGFTPIGIIIKRQYNITGKRGTMGLWKWRSIAHNFHLFEHEYLLIFKKIKK